MAYIPPTNSVVAFQSDPTKLLVHASVSGTVTTTGGNSSVQVVGQIPPASVSGVGTFNVNPVGSGSMYAVLKDSSVAALQGTNPWVVQLTSGSVITTGGNSSVQVVGQMPPQSVSGVGQFTVNHVGNGSVVAVLKDSSVAALQGTNPWFVQLTSGSVITTGGNSSVQVVGLMPPQSVSGVGTFNVNPVGNGSVIAVLTTSSVAALQGTNPWQVIVPGSVVTVWKDSSVLAALTSTNASVISRLTNSSVATLQGTNPWIVAGSVFQYQAGTTITSISGTLTIGAITSGASIVGTYQEDNAHTSADRGLFTLGVRNDTVASFTSATLDYSPIATDSAGRTLTKPFSGNEASVWSTASAVSAGTASGVASVVVFPAAGAGLKNYITDFAISNTGATTTLVTFIDNDNSILGKFIAPTGGGSNMPGLNMPIVNVSLNNRIGMILSASTSVLHVWAAGYKAP